MSGHGPTEFDWCDSNISLLGFGITRLKSPSHQGYPICTNCKLALSFKSNIAPKVDWWTLIEAVSRGQWIICAKCSLLALMNASPNFVIRISPHKSCQLRVFLTITSHFRCEPELLHLVLCCECFWLLVPSPPSICKHSSNWPACSLRSGRGIILWTTVVNHYWRYDINMRSLRP
jgi:hypothetical protein